MTTIEKRVFPAEWRAHETWACWPHYKKDWPDYFDPVELDFAEIVRLLSRHERVNIICKDARVKKRARRICKDVHCRLQNCRFFLLNTDRSWLRDSGPTGVIVDGKLRWLGWNFQGWGKCYQNFRLDQKVPAAIAQWTGAILEKPFWDDGEPVELEGGAIETNGAGILMTTEECLLSGPHWRNKGRTKAEYEDMFRRWLGIRKVLWLGQGMIPDQTQGHIDNVARFVAHNRVLLAKPVGAHDPNLANYLDNRRRIELSGLDLDIFDLPYPEQNVMRCGERLPASYINFYIGTRTVIVPVFNDLHDQAALALLSMHFPNRRVVGRYSRNIAWGYGGDHCLLQQQPIVPK